MCCLLHIYIYIIVVIVSSSRFTINETQGKITYTTTTAPRMNPCKSLYVLCTCLFNCDERPVIRGKDKNRLYLIPAYLLPCLFARLSQ